MRGISITWYSLQGLTDEIAIKEQAKENLMFAVGEMNYEAKVNMSQRKDELILKCSFNQRDCDIEKWVNFDKIQEHDRKQTKADVMTKIKHVANTTGKENASIFNNANSCTKSLIRSDRDHNLQWPFISKFYSRYLNFEFHELFLGYNLLIYIVVTYWNN